LVENDEERCGFFDDFILGDAFEGVFYKRRVDDDVVDLEKTSERLLFWF
jgi:hypothetical protein